MAKSIMQEGRQCYLCGRPETWDDPLDKHHVFGGALRSKSEAFGLTVYLHHNSCHIFGENAVHVNAIINRQLQEEAQEAAMKKYGWTTEEFIQYFGRNYVYKPIIEKDNCCVKCGEIIPEGRMICPKCEKEDGG